MYCCYVQIEFMIMVGLWVFLWYNTKAFYLYGQVFIKLVFKTVSDIFNRPVYRTSPVLERPNCPRPVNRNYPRQYSVLFSASRYTSTLGTINKPSSTIYNSSIILFCRSPVLRTLVPLPPTTPPQPTLHHGVKSNSCSELIVAPAYLDHCALLLEPYAI